MVMTATSKFGNLLRTRESYSLMNS